MPQLRGMRAVVQILTRSAEPCAAPPTSPLHSFADVAMRGKNVRVNRWVRQARQPTLTACGRMAKSARCCLPRPSRRFAKRTNEPWALNSQDTIAFVSARCGSPAPLFPLRALVCPCGSDLDVYRLLGLTLRPSALV